MATKRQRLCGMPREGKEEEPPAWQGAALALEQQCHGLSHALEEYEARHPARMLAQRILRALSDPCGSCIPTTAAAAADANAGKAGKEGRYPAPAAQCPSLFCENPSRVLPSCSRMWEALVQGHGVDYTASGLWDPRLRPVLLLTWVLQLFGGLPWWNRHGFLLVHAPPVGEYMQPHLHRTSAALFRYAAHHGMTPPEFSPVPEVCGVAAVAPSMAEDRMPCTAATLLGHALLAAIDGVAQHCGLRLPTVQPRPCQHGLWTAVYTRVTALLAEAEVMDHAPCALRRVLQRSATTTPRRLEGVLRHALRQWTAIKYRVFLRTTWTADAQRRERDLVHAALQHAGMLGTAAEKAIVAGVRERRRKAWCTFLESQRIDALCDVGRMGMALLTMLVPGSGDKAPGRAAVLEHHAWWWHTAAARGSDTPITEHSWWHHTRLRSEAVLRHANVWPLALECTTHSQDDMRVFAAPQRLLPCMLHAIACGCGVATASEHAAWSTRPFGLTAVARTTPRYDHGEDEEEEHGSEAVCSRVFLSPR